MKHYLYIFCIVLCLVIVATQPVFGQYIWTGAEPSSTWTEAANWDGPAGYPDDEDDSATIPWLADTGQTPYPVLDDMSITVKSLTMEEKPGGGGGAELSIASNMRLTIHDRDGLVVETGARVTLVFGRLILAGGGIITLDGVITGLASGGNSAVDFTGNHTYVTTGSGAFLGGGALLLSHTVGTYGTLVLGPGNAIRGNVEIVVPLVNNGTVNPNNSIDEDPHGPYQVTLECEPKTGAGQWLVTCDGDNDCAADESGCVYLYRNRMIVETLVFGDGTLSVQSFSFFRAASPVSLHGDLTITGEQSGACVNSSVLFEFDRFSPMGCPGE